MDAMLDIGCGENKREGAIGVDFRKTRSVDVIADAHFLPFVNESFDHIYSSMVIEHFSHCEIRSILERWIDCLKKGGVLEIRCPDLRVRALLFLLNPSWRNMVYIYGGQDYQGNYHKCGFSYQILKGLLVSLGIRDVKRVIKGYKHIPFLPDSLHIKGIKK